MVLPFGVADAMSSLPDRVRRAIRDRFVPAVRAFAANPAMVTRMALVIAVLPLLERALSLPAMLRLLMPSGGRRADQPQGMAVGPALATCRTALAPLLGLRVGRFRDNCMTRSLVLFHCLRRAAVPVSVHFGVERRQDDLAGHCWLELEGRPIAEDPEPLRRLQMTYSYPAT